MTHDVQNILFKFQSSCLQIQFNFNLAYLINKIDILDLYIDLNLILSQFVYAHIDLYIYIYIYIKVHIYIHISIYTYTILRGNLKKSS